MDLLMQQFCVIRVPQECFIVSWCSLKRVESSDIFIVSIEALTSSVLEHVFIVTHYTSIVGGINMFMIEAKV